MNFHLLQRKASCIILVDSIILKPSSFTLINFSQFIAFTFINKMVVGLRNAQWLVKMEVKESCGRGIVARKI